MFAQLFEFRLPSWHPHAALQPARFLPSRPRIAKETHGGKLAVRCEVLGDIWKSVSLVRNSGRDAIQSTY